jgi:TRAP-type C4-dicarboxylate transport system permease small subunit
MTRTGTNSSVVERASHAYIRFMDRVAWLLWGIGIGIFVVLTLVVVGSVVSRQLLGFVPAWSGELQRYLAIWMTLLVAGALINSDNHLSVRFSFEYMPDRVVTLVRYAQLGVIVAIGAVFINWGTEYVLDSGTASVSPSMGFQMGWVYLILPITGWLFVLFAVSRALQLRHGDEEIDVGRSISRAEDGGGH